MTRAELAFFLMGAYIDKQPKANPINRHVAETFVAGGLACFDWVTNSREAHEELTETFKPDDGVPVSPESREYLRRKLEI